MPADADTWPAIALRVVLLHELAHVKRRDCLTHLVAQIACAAYWFNPLAWMAARRLRTERERACDDLVLASGTRGSDYADQLLDIARVMRAGRFPAVLAGASLAMAQRSQLEGRLMAILDPSVPRRGLTRARAAGGRRRVRARDRPGRVRAAVGGGAAAVKAGDAEMSQARRSDQDPQQRRSRSSRVPGQADADNRRNAKNQDVIQGRVQGDAAGTDPGGIQGGIQGGVQGGVRGRRRRRRRRGQSGVGEIAVAGVPWVGDRHRRGQWRRARVSPSSHGESRTSRNRTRTRTGRPEGPWRDPRTVNALMEALKDTDKEVRETAMHALVQMRDPRMFEPLVAALKDTSADVREQAAFGLGQMRDARAIEPLAGALKDTNASVREQAVFALGQLRAASAIEAITTAVRDTQPQRARAGRVRARPDPRSSARSSR